MELFTQLFGDLLAFVYHCFDRIVIYGYLSGLSRPEQVHRQRVYPRLRSSESADWPFASRVGALPAGREEPPAYGESEVLAEPAEPRER
jgi:hypothetical protein